MAANIILQSENIAKHFYDPEKKQILKNISFQVRKGEFLGLTGKSGSGKSTLLYILSTMDTDYEGVLIIDGQHLKRKSQDQLATFRNKHLGFVFQFHYLLPDFSAIQNVMLPALKLKSLSEGEVEAKAYAILSRLGLQEVALKLSSKLSGGQQQRVAIARALINDPSIIMGDEPTGNLDLKNTQIIFELFKDLSREFNQTIITVTHDHDFANRCDRVIALVDGEIVGS